MERILLIAALALASVAAGGSFVKQIERIGSKVTASMQGRSIQAAQGTVETNTVQRGKRWIPTE